MEIIRLGKEHKEAVIEINRFTVDNLIDPTFYIPFSQEEIEKAFNGSGEIILYGIIDNGILAAVSGLFEDISDLTGELKLSDANQAKTAEIGACMTLPEFRGKGYMLALNRALVEFARQQGITRLVATAHPENTASNRSLGKLGMRKLKEFYRHENYRRNLFIMEL